MDWETEEDKAIQAAIVVELADAWDLREICPLPQYSVCDYFLIRDTGFALVEIKRRNNKSLHYVTLIISRAKMDRAVACAEALRVPFILVIQWDDGIFWQELDRADLNAFKQKMGGKHHETDASEYEVVYEIPSASFRPLRKIA